MRNWPPDITTTTMAQTTWRHALNWRPSTRAGRPRRRRRRWSTAGPLQQDQTPSPLSPIPFAKRSPQQPMSNSNQNSLPLVAVQACNLLIVCCALMSRGVWAQSLSIQPGDFDRLIMPCYLGGGPFSSAASSGAYNARSSSEPNYSPRLGGQNLAAATYFGSGSDQLGARAQTNPSSGSSMSSSSAASMNYLGNSAASSQGLSSSLNGAGPLNGQPRDSLTSNLGQTLPRANTVENFIALVSKIEAANPRLANNPDQLIRLLLGRFRLDNYYYDVRARTPISETDKRTGDILPALMSSSRNSAAGGGELFASGGFASSNGGFIEQVLDQDEKCSMYFMLSHFVDKSAPTSSSMALGGMPLVQLAGPQQGQRAPSYQAAGTGYPANSARAVYSSSATNSNSQRYPGPAPSFGSPLTNQMTGFGAGVSNTSPEQANQRSPYGVNSPQLTEGQYQSAVASQQLRNPQSSFPNGPQARPPYIDVGGRYSASGANQNQQQLQRQEERLATEYGVVTISNQDNSAVVLNRVLLGILAANTPAQTIRQLAPVLYPTQDLTSTPRLDEELDPLFAVTLADLWAVSSIPKAASKQILLGAAGRWNSQMCPTSFALERAHSIRFTTAELLGGLDGLNLGTFRRRLNSMRRHLKLSELLRIYYSRTGFKPQYPDVGVCQRGSILNTQLDELRRQSENYLRLYQLNLPTSDQEIALQIARLDAFREFANRAASATPDICQQADNDLYLMDNSQDNCEMSRADIVTVLDSSQQANKPFMQLVTLKLAQKVGLSRQSNSLSILTNQQDSVGSSGGGYMFNSIVRNSTNLGEIGCALVYDTSSSYQGGQITDATKLMEMFERALVSLDTEYLMRVRREENQSYLSGRQSSTSYISSWFGGGEQSYVDSSRSYSSRGNSIGGPQMTGGAKIIVWFNYGPQSRSSRPMSGPTDWIKGQTSMSSYEEQNEYRFHEAKKLLRENFRGASILALSPNRDDVKAFVYDEERDILTDLAQANNGANIEGYQSAALSPPTSMYDQPASEPDSGAYAMLSGQADQLVSKLMRRMCSIPAIFQYPMCFRVASESVSSVGYISPGRRQYWMMSPKTFFASQSVRMIFRVEGGRLRVCFGRKPNPDESAARNTQSSGYQQSGSPFQPGGQQQAGLTQPSSNDYYTGLEYGVCKDVGQNQEIDFLVSDPCYRKSIAECEPFYFVIRELSLPGEGDPNYMCRDDGCKRIDQAKFTMTHTGVSCNSGPRGQHASWFLIMISTLAASIFTLSQSTPNKSRSSCILKSSYSYICLLFLVAYLAVLQQVAEAQQGTTYDFGQGRAGEKRGNFTPSEVVALILIVMLILGGLALTVALCYYVTKRAKEGLQPVSQDEYS